MDFTDLNLTACGGSSILARTARQHGLFEPLADAVRVKVRNRGATDAETLCAIVACLSRGDGSLSDLDALRADDVARTLLGLRNVPRRAVPGSGWRGCVRWTSRVPGRRRGGSRSGWRRQSSSTSWRRRAMFRCSSTRPASRWTARCSSGRAGTMTATGGTGCTRRSRAVCGRPEQIEGLAEAWTRQSSDGKAPVALDGKDARGATKQLDGERRMTVAAPGGSACRRASQDF